MQTPEEKPVVLEQLYRIIAEADALIVKESPIQGAEVLFKSKDKKDLTALHDGLVVEKPREWFHCMCPGSPAIYLYKENKEIGLVTNHHGTSIRFSLWSSDAPVMNTELWLRWFDERNIHGPREEFEKDNVRAEQYQKDYDRWLAAIPNPLKPLWSDAEVAMGSVETAPLVEAFNKEVPDQTQRILALLEWFGSGAGPWSGFPSYEDTAETMLLQYEVEDIVFAINTTNLTRAQTEGAARLFSGWTFSQQRPDALGYVPDTLKETLSNHVKSTQDQDKLARARRAFVP